MFANSFQNMLMIKTGAPALEPSMGKGAGQDSIPLGNAFSAVLNNLMNKVPAGVKGHGDDPAKALMAAMNLESVPGQKTGNVLASLAAAISGDTASKSTDLFVGARGLDVLGQLLEKAGFPSDKVQAFVAGKKQELGDSGNTVPFKTVLSSLGEFVKDNDPGTWLDISALPYVQTALTGFGFKPDETERILDSVTDKTQGVSVDKLLAKLAPYAAKTEQNTGFLKEAPGFSSLLPLKKMKAQTDDPAAEPVATADTNTWTPAAIETFFTAPAAFKAFETPDLTAEKNLAGHSFKKIEPAILNMESAVDDSSAPTADLAETLPLAAPDLALTVPPMTFTTAMMPDLFVPSASSPAPEQPELIKPETMTAFYGAVPLSAEPARMKGTDPVALAPSFAAASEPSSYKVQTPANRPEVAELLETAAKGNISLKDFAEKLESLTQGGTSVESKQAVLAPFARALSENIHEQKTIAAGNGPEAMTLTEPVNAKNLTPAFDTSKAPATLFTEQAQGIFKGHVQAEKSDNSSKNVKTLPGDENHPLDADPLALEPGAPAVLRNVQKETPTPKEGHTVQAPSLVHSENPLPDAKTPAVEPGAPAVLRDVQKEALTPKEGNTVPDPSMAHPEKPLKEKAVVREGKIEQPHALTVKVLTGSAVYAKTSEMVHAGQSEKTLPAYVTDQVARQISKAVKNGDSEIRFHIKPPDMGRVELSITHTSGGLKVSILAEHSTTRDMILNQATDLKTVLADQGIRIEKMDVGMSGDFGQSMAQARHDSDSSNRGRRQKDKPLFSVDPLSTESKDTGSAETLRGAGRYTRGRLDLVA